MSVLYPLIQALVLFAVAPLLSGITRVARARLHNRRGPGVLQEYRDIIKLLGRESVGPDASGWVFRLTPYVMVGVMLTIATALPVVTVGSPLPQLGDLITLLYLFAIARFFFAISGLDTGSPFTAIGASREAMLGVLVEPMLLLGLWVAAQVAGSTNISNITDTVYHWPLSQSIPLVLALCACAFATFIEMGKLPFDLAEAEPCVAQANVLEVVLLGRPYVLASLDVIAHRLAHEERLLKVAYIALDGVRIQPGSHNAPKRRLDLAGVR